MTSLAELADQLSPKARELLARELVRAGTVIPVGSTVAEPVAVVGIGCRFPGGVSGPQSFWELLVGGGDAISEVPGDRWDAEAFYDRDPLAPGCMTTKWGGFVGDVAGFDAEFFGITPREAAGMDPQHRLLLEVAWEALEDAGIAPDSLSGSATGLVVGLSTWDYTIVSIERRAEIDAYLSTGNLHSTAVGRVSYLLGLRGPSVAVDTACSSSLVAVHLGCQSLRLRESDLVLAGGVQLSLAPWSSIAMSKFSALSPTGRCRAFDAGADGFVRGEGCGVVVLKRLGDALADGDRVVAVVRGSAVNQDGRSNGLTAPNALAQRDVIRAALRAGDVAAGSVNYVEAHGTGTVLGDPIEFEALAATYGRGEGRCALGAVKTNLGHLEAAAGIAGFIKAVLVVQRGQVPANLHFNQWNPAIDPASTRFFVPTVGTPWPSGVGPRRAGVSSFGIGGTNAHVVVEQGPDVVGSPVVSGDSGVVSGDSGVVSLVVSGKSVSRVRSWAAVLADWCGGAGAGVGLAEVADGLSHRRARHAVFGVVCGRSRGEVVAGLGALAAGRVGRGVVLPHEGSCGSGTVFVFSGQGSQWAGMGRRLLVEEPVFAAAVAELEPVFVERVGFSLRAVLAGGEPVVGVDRVQPVLVGVQLALTRLWRFYGVDPDVVVGHSVGEVSAAVVSGGLSVAQGLGVVATRSKLLAGLAGRGAMALVELDARAAEELIADFAGVGVAVYASPRQSVIAGPPEQVDAVCAVVAAGGRLARRVEVDVASHHCTVDPVLGPLRSALGGLVGCVPGIPVISTARPGVVSPVFDADYWVDNLRNPVRFEQAVAAAGVDHCVFVEVSPHPLLTQAIVESLSGRHHHVVGTLCRDEDDVLMFHTNVAAAHTVRAPVRPRRAGPPPPLPTTPWHHTRHWVTETPGNPVTSGAKPVLPEVDLQQKTDSPIPDDWYYELTWPVRPVSDAGTPSGGSWAVLAHTDLGAEIGRLLGGDCAVTTLAPSVLADDVDSVALEVALDGRANVLYAPDVSATHLDVAAAYRLFKDGRRLAVALAARASPESLPPKLFILTRNAQPVSEGDRANPVHAILWGLGRTVALEHPEIWGGLIDVDDSMPGALAARYVVAEACAADREDQVVYRSGRRHVPRLRSRKPPATSAGVLDRDTSHLVVGATGHIGPHLIRQLADMGAATIVAVSRNPGSRLAQLAQEVSVKGTKVMTVAADAADEAAMEALFDRFGNDLPPLDGIYLAAFAGGPVTLCDMTDDHVSTMFRPKLDAVARLHALSMRSPVRQFVLFSSISGILGSRWLGHYAATTTFLDTFAYARRTLGLPATVVNWGLWKTAADTVDTADTQPQAQVIAATGLEPMPDELATRALWSAMGPDAPVRSTVVAADWPRLATAYRTRGSLRIVDDLLPGDDAAPLPTGEFREALRQCPSDERRDMLVDHVAAHAAAVMGLQSAESLAPSAGFFALGMDSLMSVRLQRALSESLGEVLPPAVVYDNPSVEALAEYLATILELEPVTHDTPERADPIHDRAAQRAALRKEAAMRRKRGQRV